MIRGHQGPHGGLNFNTTPSRRQQMSRRRWMAIAVIASVALAGAILGQMSVVRNDAARPVPPGPLTYLPF